jgi:putative salt-induced outer membrane protein
MFALNIPSFDIPSANPKKEPFMSHSKFAKLSLIAAGVLASSGAFAEPPKTDGLWRGVGGASLSATSGNSEATTALMTVDMASLTTTDKISLGGAINYGRAKVDGKTSTTSDKWNTFGQYDYNLSPQLFVFGKLAFEGDNVAKLSLRATLAGGVGYKIIETKELTFNVFGGAAYSTDKYKTSQTIGSDTGTSFSRTSLFIGEESTHQLSASTSFKQRLELYPGLTGDKAKIAKFNAGLAVAMSSTLSLNVGVTDTYNSAPPAGQKKNDMGLFVGVNLKLGAN